MVVLDYASLYPSVFIAHNICYSTLLRQQAHSAARAPPHHRTPNTVGPNTHVAGAAGDNDSRVWRGDAIAFVSAEEHTGLMPRLLMALLRERRAVKARIKQLTAATADTSGGGSGGGGGGSNGGGGGGASSANSDLVAVLDARQLVLKLLANASYGFCGADTSHLCCKPLAEACLRWGNYYCATASRIIEDQGAAHPAGAGGAGPRWPGAAVIYANTDSVFVRLPGRSPAEAAAQGREMAEYVSSHRQLPAALTLEFERVLSPCLLDGHNRYAGAEYVSGTEARPSLLQKGLFERGQCKYVQATLRGALQHLLIEGSLPRALDFARGACRKLLGGEVDADALAEGGFLKRVNQSDLLRMAGLGSGDKAERATREEDESLRKQNCYSLAIEMLKASALQSDDGKPTRVFRQGEFVPFVAVSRTGGAAGLKQFENVAAPSDAVQRGTPINLKLLYSNRVLPALFGQTAEASGRAIKAVADKPAALGRLLSVEERREFRSGSHAQVSHSGVLSCEDGWRFFGLSAPLAEPTPEKGAQKTLTSFFGKGPAGGGGGGGSGGARSNPPTPSKMLASPSSSHPPTPGGDAAAAAAAAAAAEVRLREETVGGLVARRLEIAAASGHVDGDPLLLCNCAAALANETRLLAVARAKLARLGA